MDPKTDNLIASDITAGIAAPLSQATTLPASAYTAQNIYQAELAQIFSKDWICVARVDQVPNAGDYVCADLPDQPIVITRDMQGQLNALSRICLHRAMPLAQGQGHSLRLVCPYHRWTYELDGRLRSTPMMDGVEDFDPHQCLPKLALEVWQGFIFVSLDVGAAPLAPRLGGLLPLIENYDFGAMQVLDTLTFDSPWNWKILVENFMEAYHHIGPHKQSFEHIFPARDSEVVDNFAEPWALLRMPSDYGATDAEGAFPALTDVQRHDLIAVSVFPTLLFGASATGAAWYQLEPLGVDQMRLRIHALYNPALTGELDEEARANIMAMLNLIHQEDIQVNAGPWQGWQARLTKPGRLSLYEKGLWQLNQWWLARLGL
jgi:phenylpropionate dioxygenase-like ring-hydroxylating dioxygenase large terminal subunit